MQQITDYAAQRVVVHDIDSRAVRIRKCRLKLALVDSAVTIVRLFVTICTPNPALFSFRSLCFLVAM